MSLRCQGWRDRASSATFPFLVCAAVCSSVPAFGCLGPVSLGVAIVEVVSQDVSASLAGYPRACECTR